MVIARSPSPSRSAPEPRAPSLHRSYPPFTSTTSPSDSHREPRSGLRPPSRRSLTRRSRWVSQVASTTFRTCRPHYPGWRPRILRSVAPPQPGGLPHLTEGSAPTRNFRGLLRVHSRYALHDCPLNSIQLFQRLQPGGHPTELLRRLPGVPIAPRTGLSPAGPRDHGRSFASLLSSSHEPPSCRHCQ